MNYINQLQEQRNEAQQRMLDLEEGINELLIYLASPKFRDETWVSVRDVQYRLQEIRSAGR